MSHGLFVTHWKAGMSADDILTTASTIRSTRMEKFESVLFKVLICKSNMSPVVGPQAPWLTELTVRIAATTGGSYCKDMLPLSFQKWIWNSPKSLWNFSLEQKHNCDPEKVENKDAAVSSIFMAADWLEFRPPAALVCSLLSRTARWNSRLKLAQGVFPFLCHLAWVPTPITPDRFLPYLDVKTTGLYPHISIKFLLISWQLWDYIKSTLWAKSWLRAEFWLFFFMSLFSWPVRLPSHLPPTSSSRHVSLWLLGTLILWYIFDKPCRDTLRFVGVVCVFVWK